MELILFVELNEVELMMIRKMLTKRENLRLTSGESLMRKGYLRLMSSNCDAPSTHNFEMGETDPSSRHDPNEAISAR